MTRLVSMLAVLSWFVGGLLLALIEIIKLPTNPVYSTLLQLLPLFLLVGGIWFVISQYQRLGRQSDGSSLRLRKTMSLGWVAEFGVNAGIASLNNMSNAIFHKQLPYYFQGVSLAEKIIALTGIFVLGAAAVFAMRQHAEAPRPTVVPQPADFWEKPLTNIGFIALLLGVVLGLAQYWSVVVFAGFLLLLAGVMLYPVGKFTEKDIEMPDEEPDTKNSPSDSISSIHTSSHRLRAHALGRHFAGKR
jgi:hypothetical protein